jgi:transposase
MASTRCGVSAKQIQHETGVTYKTAWRMFKQIRTMLDDEKAAPLGGKRGPGVEMDEMYYGGRRKGTVGRPLGGDFKDKETVVLGMVERKSRVRAVVAADVKGSTVSCSKSKSETQQSARLPPKP